MSSLETTDIQRQDLAPVFIHAFIKYLISQRRITITPDLYHMGAKYGQSDFVLCLYENDFKRNFCKGIAETIARENNFIELADWFRRIETPSHIPCAFCLLSDEI